MQVVVRFAQTDGERDAIFRLRADIYGQELGRGHAVDGQGRMTDPLDVTARLLLAEADGEAVGTLRLNWGGDAPFDPEDRAIYGLDALEAVVPPAGIAIFSRFAARAAVRGSAVPSQLIDATVRFALANRICLILCDCRPELINTYLKLGMRVRGPAVTTPAGLLVPLVLMTDDRAHIAATGSRIAPLLEGVPPDRRRRDAVMALLPGDGAVQLLDRPEEAPNWTDLVTVVSQVSPERFPVFHGLSVETIARLMTRANVIGCSRGDLVVRQGSTGEMVFVVLGGAVEVRRDGATLARLGPGSVFGEVAFLAGVARTADIVAAGETSLLCLRSSTMAALIENEPGLAAPLLLNLSRILALRLAGGATAPDRRHQLA